MVNRNLDLNAMYVLAYWIHYNQTRYI